MKKLLIIVILLLTFNTLSAQKWTVLASGTDNALNSVYFTNADSGYAVGTNGTILKTMNGGAAWTNISSGINKQLNDVYFTDLNTGHVVGTGAIINTTNGGATWTNLMLSSVCFPTSKIGYAVGQSGLILKSSDAGETWFKQKEVTIKDLMSVRFTGADTGYAVGSAGIILETTNGGSIWKIDTIVTSEPLYTVSLPEIGISYAAGEGGLIIKGVLLDGINNSLCKPMSLNFYPNPVKNYLTIELYELTGITDLTIFNVDGIELLEQPITEHKTNIDIRNWPQGVYFLKVTNERNVTVCKIIKE